MFIENKLIYFVPPINNLPHFNLTCSEQSTEEGKIVPTFILDSERSQKGKTIKTRLNFWFISRWFSRSAKYNRSFNVSGVKLFLRAHWKLIRRFGYFINGQSGGLYSFISLIESGLEKKIEVKGDDFNMTKKKKPTKIEVLQYASHILELITVWRFS